MSKCYIPVVWKIPEFGDNISKIFSLKLTILAFHLSDLKILSERLDKDDCS